MASRLRSTPRSPHTATAHARSVCGLSGLLLCLATSAQPAWSAPDPKEAPAPHLRITADGAVQPAPSDEPMPDPAAGGAVSLSGLLAYADRHAPRLVAARSTRAHADAARAAAEWRLPANPELSAAVGPRLGREGTGLDLELELSQPIEISGARALRLDTAQQVRAQINAEIEQIRWAVHCDVHAAFHQTLIDQDRARLAERMLSFQQEVLQIVERQIAAGEAAPLILRLAQAEAAQAQQMLLAAQQAQVASQIQLAQLAGWPATVLPQPAGDIDAPHDPPPLARLSAVAREHLPSLRAHDAQIQEAQARIDLAQREAWPQPAVGVRYVREGAVGPQEHGAHVVMGTLALSIPSFQTNQGAVAEARAQRSVAEAQRAATVHLLDGQLAQAHSEVAAAVARTRAYGAEILPRFEENLHLLRRAFELGEIDLLALFTGRERFLRIQSDALSAQQDYFVALASLERLVGVDLWRDDHHELGAPAPHTDAPPSAP